MYRPVRHSPKAGLNERGRHPYLVDPGHLRDEGIGKCGELPVPDANCVVGPSFGAQELVGDGGKLVQVQHPQIDLYFRSSGICLSASGTRDSSRGAPLATVAETEPEARFTQRKRQTPGRFCETGGSRPVPEYVHSRVRPMSGRPQRFSGRFGSWSDRWKVWRLRRCRLLLGQPKLQLHQPEPHRGDFIFKVQIVPSGILPSEALYCPFQLGHSRENRLVECHLVVGGDSHSSQDQTLREAHPGVGGQWFPEFGVLGDRGPVVYRLCLIGTSGVQAHEDKIATSGARRLGRLEPDGLGNSPQRSRGARDRPR